MNPINKTTSNDSVNTEVIIIFFPKPWLVLDLCDVSPCCEFSFDRIDLKFDNSIVSILTQDFGFFSFLVLEAYLIEFLERKLISYKLVNRKKEDKEIISELYES